MSLIGCSTTVSWCEGVPVSLKLLFKLGVGAVRQSILARIILFCVCICVMHVFVSLLELSGGIVCLSCHTAIGLGLCKSIGLHSDWFSFSATDVTSNPIERAVTLWGHEIVDFAAFVCCVHWLCLYFELDHTPETYFSDRTSRSFLPVEPRVGLNRGRGGSG